MTPPIDQLREIVARLRAKDGCPWDREQTHASLRPGLLEEAHEVVEAIEAIDALAECDDSSLRERADAELSEELGDLLLQVVMHSQIAAETGRFTFDTVAEGIAEKLVRRHPHVFGAAEADDSAAVVTQWEEIKRDERRKKGASESGSALDGVTGGLPALMHAEKVAKKAAKVGFDWQEPAPVFDKIREELAEIEQALRHGEAAERIEEEVGDLLFAVANLARKVGVNGEVALRRATGKFSRRFRQVEQVIAARGQRMEDCTLEELDAVWDAIKKD